MARRLPEAQLVLSNRLQVHIYFSLFGLSSLYRETKRRLHLHRRCRFAPPCFAALADIEIYQQAQTIRNVIYGCAQYAVVRAFSLRHSLRASAIQRSPSIRYGNSYFFLHVCKPKTKIRECLVHGIPITIRFASWNTIA